MQNSAAPDQPAAALPLVGLDGHKLTQDGVFIWQDVGVLDT